MSEAYDRSLAKAAPAVTNTQIEEGYDANLLRDSPPAYPKPETNLGGETVLPSRALPFWRTRKGILIIAIAVVAILAVIIGGAVGGTTSKKGHKGANGFALTNTTSTTASSAKVSQTVAVLTTTLFGSDTLPITTLTLSTTIQLSQTASGSTSLSTSQPPVTTTVVLTESTSQTTTVTAFFSTSTEAPNSFPGFATPNAAHQGGQV
ncbi:hypothetical protein DL96DRAFT_1580389 [Flagelloscypha sp. PMI_526]|nr:hypothetical protein DL96DRAFT_1580389 [Flagelloscypha sp. PMI_526]